ncbi:MAG TPA: DUF5060 domain-containing protein [Bryobacteraceae bacterium]|nr:DUF5060 domain-containing protein [Bryobacteraceae bacterium]
MGIRLAAVAAGLLPLLLRAQSPCDNTPAYSTCELVFDLDEKDAAANPVPYATADLQVEFRSPRRRTLSMPAYWDGGRRLVVRFAPTEAGAWDYHITSNLAGWNDKTATFTAAASDSPGFVRAANLHHWAYTEKDPRGLDRPHLWMGATEMQFATLDDAAFSAVADARAAQKFNHLRGLVQSSAGTPDLAYFRRLDGRVRYLNQKGITADLILAASPGDLAKVFPGWEQRRRLVRFLVGRYAAFHVTWQAANQWEGDPGARDLLKEIGTLLKQSDPYQHPRTAGARLTSTPLLDDKWMDFAAQGTADDQLGAIEHQIFPVPFVNVNLGREDSGAGKSGPGDVDAATFRHRLWNATMDGQYVTYANTGSGAAYANSPGAKAMTVWFEFLSATRHWELEPYFDVDGGRALALEDTEYVVYVEKPGPVELTVEKHAYEVYWINPIDGESVKKKFSGEHFTGEPPDKSHDWLLHVVRESHLESMNRSFKFSSREQDLALQEVEANSAKVPFSIERPTGDLSLSMPAFYAAKVTRETRATRSMLWLWMGEVAADHQGYRVLATGPTGTMPMPADIAINFPATMHLRLYGMNANGKVYELDAAFQVNR